MRERDLLSQSFSGFKRGVKPMATAAAFLAALLAVLPLAAQRERPTLNITGYVIDAELDTTTHHLAAKAVVAFTAPENAEVVSFGFHPALKVTKISDETRQAAHRRALRRRHHPRDPGHAVCHRPGRRTGPSTYEGTITGNEDGPVEGLKLAAIQEPITYLLYPARWFPMTGYLTDRFTAEMHIRVPQGMRVFASGAQGGVETGHAGQRQAGRPVRLQLEQAGISRNGDCRPVCGPGFGGRRQREGLPDGEPPGVRPTNWRRRRPRNTTSLPTALARRRRSHLNVVELPDDTLPAVWAPELAAIQGSRVGDKSGIRLLANTIAHQWWGSEVSPRTLNDAWITNGMARYGELMYVEEESGKSAHARRRCRTWPPERWPTTRFRCRAPAACSPFSPEFQSMTLEKGAMIFHMLRWEIGDKAFLATLKGALSQYTDSGMRAVGL